RPLATPAPAWRRARPGPPGDVESSSRISRSSVADPPPQCEAGAVGAPARPAAGLGTGSGRTSGWGGAAVGAAHRGGARARTRSFGRSGRAQLRGRLLRLELRPGVMTQRAAQLVVQRDASGGMLRLDVNRRAQPLRR